MLSLVCYHTVVLDFWRFYLFSRNILTDLNAVVADGMKGAEEKVLLDPHPVLIGISEQWEQQNTSNKCINHSPIYNSCSCSALTLCSAWPPPGSDRPWWRWTALPDQRPLRLPAPQPGSTPSSGPARRTAAHWSCGWNTTAGWCPALYAAAMPLKKKKITHTGRKKGTCWYRETIKERVSEERKNIRGFTSSWRLGRMTLKCTRTDRKVQLLVFVFSWSWTENIKAAQ